MQRVFIISIFLIILVSYNCFSAIPDEMGTEDAAFLKIDAASRPVAMGGAFAGLANDVSSVFWNPAGLVQTEKKEFSAMYSDWLAALRYMSGAYSQLLGNNVALGASMQGIWTDIEKRTADTEKPDSTFGVYSFAAGLTGSYALIPKVFSLGTTLKVISQDFDVESSNGIALDAGTLIRISNLGIGASIQNIKLQMSNDYDIPLIFRFGGAYKFAKDGVLVVEYNKMGAGDPSYHFGIEKWVRGILAVRLGYCIGTGDNPKGGLSAGFGWKAYGTKPLEDMNFQLDYAYVPAPDWGGMGDAHRISMIVRF